MGSFIRARRCASILVATLLVAGCANSQPPHSTPVAGTDSPPLSASTTTTAGHSLVPATPGLPSAAPTASLLPQLGALPTSRLDDATARSLQSALDTIVKRGAPDAIAAVVTAEGSWAGAAGIDGPNGRAATVNDEFAVASVSKTFTAALIMRLVEQGKIDLDQPLAAYLGAMAVDTNGATVRQALGMRAGLGNTTPETITAMYTDCAHVWTPAEIVAKFPPPIAPAGTAYEYSNPTYKLLGFAAEQVTGMPLSTAMRAVLPEDATGDHLIVQGPGRLTPKPWALPVDGFGGAVNLPDFGTGGTLPCLADSTFSGGAAGMASDAASLARWGWLLFSGKVLQPATLTTMVTDATDGNGLGIDQFSDFSPDLGYGHAGSKPGYASLLAVLPERGIVVAMFVNSEQEDVFADARSLIAGL